MKHPEERWLSSVGWTRKDLQRYGMDREECRKILTGMLTTCRDAWTCGFLRGFNGNMSMRPSEGSVFFVTGTGVAKGHMTISDISLARTDGSLICGRSLSSETAMHAAIYRRRSDVSCILHVHPAALLALSLRVPREQMLALSLFEAQVWRDRLGFVGAITPGGAMLAEHVAACLGDEHIQAVFMARHGLCAAGNDPVQVLGICEQMEHLATTQLLSLQQG